MPDVVEAILDDSHRRYLGSGEAVSDHRSSGWDWLEGQHLLGQLLVGPMKLP